MPHSTCGRLGTGKNRLPTTGIRTPGRTAHSLLTIATRLLRLLHIYSQDRQYSYKRNNNVRSRKHCCSGKAVLIILLCVYACLCWHVSCVCGNVCLCVRVCVVSRVLWHVHGACRLTDLACKAHAPWCIVICGLSVCTIFFLITS